MTLIRTELSYLMGGDNFLQSGFWGEFKSRKGWEAFAYRYEWRGESLRLLVLVRRFFRFLSMAYVPFGPDLTGVDDGEHLAELGNALQAELPLGTLFVRFDLRDDRVENSDLPDEGGLRKAPADIQPPDTVLLDISRSDDDIREGMHRKWRYNIRLAEKKGVRVSEASPDLLYRWYELYKITGERDRIALHPESYYKDLFRLAGLMEGGGAVRGRDFPDFRLWLAYHDEELLAGIITVFYGKRATYLYGASSNRKRNVMPAYALQWTAIQAAKEAGCTEYDFFGIPPRDDPSHPMHGLYRFKTNFGGRVVHYLGSWDLPYGKLFYTIYRFAERGRQWYYKVLKKRP